MTIIVCFVLIVGFYSVYLFSEFNYIVEELEIIEKIENEFFLQDFGDKNKIFIVGSSHIRPLDPQYIEKELSEKNLDFQVFNLSIMGDTPLKRIKSIEKIASTKPELVLYGVGFRDFSKIENLKPDALDFFPTKSSDKILPDIREILMDEFQLEDYYSKKFGMLKSPKYYSFSLIQNLGQNNKNVKEVSNREFSYHLPFNNHASSKTTIPISELENRVNSDSWTNFDENNVNFKKLIEIAKILQKENIPLVIFSTPHSKPFLEIIPKDDLRSFQQKFNNLVHDFNIPTHHFYDSYQDLDIWADPTHVISDEKGTIYNQDIIKLIMKMI